jgi:hypothetical protein
VLLCGALEVIHLRRVAKRKFARCGMLGIFFST